MPTNAPPTMTEEHRRLLAVQGDDKDNVSWRRWGPYVSDRSWATVREDYSDNGNAWAYLPHDLARSKTYRWGEDGIAGLCDRYQFLTFAPAFWNGCDPYLKERLFGLTPDEANHGEDVKEYYYHLDNTPTHSYMKFLYKYPQSPFPYEKLTDENRARHGQGFEYELIDTGVFDNDRYFDIFIEYAKLDEDDIVIRIEAFNRGPEPAPLHILPNLWFRNTWSWSAEAWDPKVPRHEPQIRLLDKANQGPLALQADDEACVMLKNLPIRYALGPRTLYGPPGAEPLFTDNETNMARVFGPGHVSRSAFVKDAFHRHVVNGENCINPRQIGTKAALHYRFDAIPAGESVVLHLRLTDKTGLDNPLAEADSIVDLRRREADAFYNAIHPPGATEDERLIQRQAFAGLLWTKQSYIFDVHAWLKGDNPDFPPPESRWGIRNQHWLTLNSMRIMSVCDKWEYPWFAAWDLAFHCAAFALIDPQYAKDQLWFLLFEQFQHPNGQIPAYEWEFSDLNPPVHAWAVWRVYHMAAEFDNKFYGNADRDRDFLERSYHKLLINFAWWVNKVDRKGNNIFEGGFLGLDNITVVDRSMQCAGGAVLEQADATGWMGMFCLNLMRIALELAKANQVYESMATKFFQHYAYVAGAMKRMGGRDYQLWDERDGFFYDVLRYPNGEFHKFRVRSLVGLIPLFAVERLDTDWIDQFPNFRAKLDWFLRNRPDLVTDVVHQVHDEQGNLKTHVLTIVNQDQLHRLLERVWDPEEFLSDYGIRSLSRAHRDHPFVFEDKVVSYEPAEAVSKLKGGNSNWRGPIWFPTNFLLIESLRKLGKAYGPTDGLIQEGSTTPILTYREMAAEIAARQIAIFKRGPDGRRPVFGGARKFQEDPHWRDHILFYEYFHGDEGAGLGASHQTGWTALVACLIHEWRREVPATKAVQDDQDQEDEGAEVPAAVT
ncbi:glucosidase [soil metagenome]